MPSQWPASSLLHPAYGSAAQSIRAAVGVSRDEQTARLARQLDGVRRAIVLRDRDFRGFVIAGGDHSGARVTPDHKRFTEIGCPDGTVLIEVGEHPHKLTLRVDVAAVCAACPPLDPDDIIEGVKGRLLADTAWLDEVCGYCDTGTPPPPWPGG